MNKEIYICDYLNIFSDYREIKYKKNNVNFHDIKHANLEIDTIEFFKLFFTKYIYKVNIQKSNKFIFIIKKITNYEKILNNVLKEYFNIDIHFYIIENKYNDILLDKNKDDFLCQYLLTYYNFKNQDCHMISNDKYRDKIRYYHKFTNIIVKILSLNSNNIYTIKIDKLKLHNDSYFKKRKAIPKYKLFDII